MPDNILFLYFKTLSFKHSANILTCEYLINDPCVLKKLCIFPFLAFFMSKQLKSLFKSTFHCEFSGTFLFAVDSVNSGGSSPRINTRGETCNQTATTGQFEVRTQPVQILTDGQTFSMSVSNNFTEHTSDFSVIVKKHQSMKENIRLT